VGTTTGETHGWNSGTPVTDPLPPIPKIEAVNRRPPPSGARRDWQFARVTEIRSENPRMKSFRLKCSPPMLHTPGQHVVVRLTAPDGYQASRSYSISSAPDDGSEIELMVERLEDGEVSMFLHDGVGVGDEIEIRGSFGGWFVWNGSRPALLIGGGSGVVPLMSMLRYRRIIAERGPVPAMNLLVSVRAPEDLPFAHEYGEESTVIYTRSAPPEWPGRVGRLTADTLQPLLIEDSTAYICGSSGFVEHASQLLIGLGHPVNEIRLERYGPT